jgi:two-component system phosphate regulon response regulator PhoB
MSTAHILIIEDEPAIAEILQYNLQENGFRVSVEGTGDRGLAALRRQPPDLVILDLMLPGLDGLEITRLLKRDAKTARVPIVMLTAKDDELDRIVGLELGADDYVTKPFSPREVVLRVKAILRRGQEVTDDGVLTFGGLRIDCQAHRVFVGVDEVRLTVTEFRLLEALARGRDRVQSRSRLLQDVWGYSEDTDSRTVDTHIRRLRHKLRSAGEDPIETVIGVGYRLRSE